MNSIRYRVVFCLSVLLFAFTTCKTVKRGYVKPKATGAEKLHEKLTANELDFDWMSLKAKIDYDGEESSEKFSVNIRLRKDSIIWASITPLLGIEALRIKLTPDSVKIIDRVNKQFLRKPFRYLSWMFNAPIDFTMLQSIIIGNAIYYDTTGLTASIEGKYHVLKHSSKGLDNTIWLNAGDFTIAKMHVIDQQYARTFLIKYEDYRQTNNTVFSYEREIIFGSSESKQAKISYSRLKLNGPLSFPFNIPDKYEHIN